MPFAIDPETCSPSRIKRRNSYQSLVAHARRLSIGSRSLHNVAAHFLRGSDAPPSPPPPVPPLPKTIENDATQRRLNEFKFNAVSNPSLPVTASRTSSDRRPPVAEAVYSFKLLEALRKGDQQALIPLLQPTRKNEVHLAKESTSPLHLAVRCADFNIISFLLNYKTINLNAVEAQHANTALHIASASGRDDVVQLLLEQEDIDDSKRNHDGKDALMMAKTPEIAQQIQVSRAQLNVRYLELLAAYETETPGADAKLHHLLELPRHAVIDLNAQSSNGSTLLHEAVKREDTRMIETAVRKGADVYARDRRGKRVNDVTKDEKIKALLRQLHNADAAKATQASQSGQPPSFKGYLGKWTNLAQGYKTRWFVLEDGILSYYHSQDDEGKQSRGAINMRFAKIRADNNDKHRLEIISETGKGTSKLYLRGTHPVERARWVQVLQQTKEHFNLERQSSRAESFYRQRAPSTSSVSNSFGMQGLQSATSLANPAGIVRPSSTAPSEKGSRGGLLSIMSPSTQPPSGAASERSLTLANRSPSLLSRLSSDGRGDDENEGGATGGSMPFETEFPLTAEALRAQAEASQRLVETLIASNAPLLAGAAISPNRNSSEDGSTGKHSRSSRVSTGSFNSNGDTIRSALESVVRSNLQLVERYQTMVAAREAYMTKRYERELQIKHLWEENMAVLAQQHAEMESQLKEAAAENARRRKALREVRETMGSSPGSVLSPPLSGAGGAPLKAHEPCRQSTVLSNTTSRSYETANGDVSGSLAARRLGEEGRARLQLDDRLTPPIQAQRVAILGIADDRHMIRDSIDDADDEFFDAIETGNLPGLKVDRSLAEPEQDSNTWPERFDPTLAKDDLFQKALEPYKHLRTQMPIGKDDRPSVSLWAILKSNIGKDLTKISFPVSFNEPTSMLQRMAEDMEFSECLDAAALQEDSTKRIAYVAAFAMSNYSSTIGRVAKPFNPLLGETFEYMRPDKKYRYYSEQVSHHPPISACFAQSPTWEYMGCVDAKSKFLGRTFEIRPTGVAHVNLKVPREWVNTDRELQSAPMFPDDHVLEHYTWNKVTTSVSGFIVGSPTIDHFGDMEVTNHATGDRCVLTFKPRGWRGKDAFEIRGSVSDAQGNMKWDIAGRWNSQLVARKCGAGSGDLNPDQSVDVPNGQIATAQPLAEYLLLWRNSEKPPTPFNLTPFAITLNSCPDDLRPWLAPTDCRLRPDLSAFESGKFDQANDLKQKLENFQRETRRKRETGELPPHEPKWFKRTTDQDTKETLWQPAPSIQGAGPGGKELTNYWAERYEVGSKKMKGQAADWNGVYHIFGDFEVR
ncbi:related to SWH1 - Member of an oxysterol-binding protein family [Melanopsichium pennsylvanicum]|uniref:Related to SWH1 - Member of an oxysterol-binding protein family n=2 Tax=Melanopsichium pennsylvanicum TaxID=63383 RepID=A0AAJ4XPC0_9BASI|nr:related to SWH1-Member of an oxysterol-binding protein family [Melanopsichium pennsylvanicum 4]SNX84698.1 related to SWH1 - Member of an oxysterol-binding protein family [Melanopsichium pennsylvanicum]